MQVSLRLNGAYVAADVEARTSLADFVRAPARGCSSVHLACEHGVCGACTVVIDGAIARSCISLAATCDGSEVMTLEGLADDALTAELRKAFHLHHGLQCGFCTPAMLITAREVILRGVDVTEDEVRLAMSGNLCRCTGYAGIVDAIMAVVAQRAAARE